MTGPNTDDFNRLLQGLDDREGAIDDELFTLLYRELHGRARRLLGAAPSDFTLQPTALVHEAYMKLAGGQPRTWANRRHFLSVAGMAMRQILVDHVRSRQSSKRNAQGDRVPIEGILIDYEERALNLDELDVALRNLAEFDPEMEQAVELRFFAGATLDEVAEILGLSKRTTERRWRAARAWLFRKMGSRSPDFG